MRATLLKVNWIVRGAAVGFAALLLASCGGGYDGAAPTTTSAKATTTTLDAKSTAATLDGYRGYWTAYLKSADPMDPDNPLLQQHATGPALEAVEKAFIALRSAGKVIRGQLDLAPRVVNVDGDIATVRDCYGDDTGVYDASTGARDDKPSGERHLVTASLRLAGGTWKVERLTNEGTGCTAA